MESSFVESVWRTHSECAGAFISTAETHWEMVVSRHIGQTTITMRGPETKVKHVPFPKNAEFFGIVFKHGVFMPHLPGSMLVDEEIHLPEAASDTFWLHCAAWELPTFENAEDFIARLVREEMLVFDPVVEVVLQNRPLDLSIRSIQRRFRRATGLTHGTFDQIRRAHRAANLLARGFSIADAVFQAGYADQPHLTRSLKQFIGQTPGQIISSDSAG